MKLFICLAIVAVAVASPAVSSGSVNVQEVSEGDVQSVQPVQPFDLTRLRKAAYGGSSSSGGYGGSSSSGGYGGSSSSGATIQAPPCAKNYIFSCQPSLSPVACSAPSSSSSYGSQGAYSAPVPSYVAPLPNHGYGFPQGFAYTNQYYQY